MPSPASRRDSDPAPSSRPSVIRQFLYSGNAPNQGFGRRTWYPLSQRPGNAALNFDDQIRGLSYWRAPATALNELGNAALNFDDPNQGLLYLSPAAARLDYVAPSSPIQPSSDDPNRGFGWRPVVNRRIWRSTSERSGNAAPSSPIRPSSDDPTQGLYSRRPTVTERIWRSSDGRLSNAAPSSFSSRPAVTGRIWISGDRGGNVAPAPVPLRPNSDDPHTLAAGEYDLYIVELQRPRGYLEVHLHIHDIGQHQHQSAVNGTVHINETRTVVESSPSPATSETLEVEGEYGLYIIELQRLQDSLEVNFHIYDFGQHQQQSHSNETRTVVQSSPLPEM